MRLYIRILLFSLFMVTLSAIAGNDKVNFSGAWSLNETKSDLGEGRRGMVALKMTIRQTGDSLAIERLSKRRSGEESTSIEKLTIDGKECTNTVFERLKKSTASRSKDGKTITILSKMTFEREGEEIEIKSSEAWTLLEDGKILSIAYGSTSPRGERKATYVYDKVSK